MKKLLFLLSFLMLAALCFAQGETKIHTSQIHASGASDNQVMTYDSATDKWRAENSQSGGDNWGSQVVASDGTLTGDGTSGSPLAVNGDLTDNQTIDSLILNGTILEISLQDDGELRRSLELSSINTDTQDLGYTANTGLLTLTDGGNVTILVSAQFTEEVFSNLTSGNTTTISGAFPSDLDGVVITRNGVVQRRGATFDYTISGQVVTFEARDFEHGETVIIKYPN